MTDLYLNKRVTSSVLKKFNKQEMCDIINEVRGYAMTPDTWTREELINYLIDGGIYLSWLNGHKQTNKDVVNTYLRPVSFVSNDAAVYPD